MSKSVDNRIVGLGFDNKQFESGVKTSINTLTSLKKGLDLTESAKSLNNLNAAGKSFSLDGISEGVEQISSKFSVLGISGVTALANITNAAVTAGLRMVKALTLEPVITGFQEYELKMGAIQTIMAGSGESLATVNQALKELNEYSDLTIYSFSDMTQNIGKFINAGVSLEGSTAAIKGISNVAAISGANAGEAARAMYNFAQALSSGSVRLMDWKSIENANMATVGFKTELLESAVAAGQLTKTTDGLYKTLKGTVISPTKMFNQSLEELWMTSDVLVGTLQKYSDVNTDIGKRATAAATEVKTFTQMIGTMKETVQSGWATSWESIIGDKDQSVKTLTAINDAFSAFMGPSTDARNAMLAFWNANEGRDALIESVKNAVKGLGSVIKPISEAFREIFPAMTGERLVALTKGLQTLTEKFKMGDDTAQALKTTFKGLFSIVDIIAQVIGTFVRGIAAVVGVVLPAGNGILFLTSSIGNFLINLHDSIEASGIFASVLETLKTIIKPIPSMFDGVGKIGMVFYNLAAGIGRAFGIISEHITDGIEKFNFERMFGIINGGLFATILYAVKKFIGSLTGLAIEGKGFLANITGIFDGVMGCLQAYQTQLKAGTLLKIASAVGLLAASLYVLSLIDQDKLGSSLIAISALFAGLMVSMTTFGTASKGIGIKSMITLSTTMTAMATAILILSAAMTVISKLDWPGVAKGLISVAGLAAVLVITAKSLSVAKGQMIKGAIGFILFAAAITILTTAVERLSKIPTNELTRGLIGIGALMAGLVIFMNTANMSGMGVRTGTGIILLAGALYILASAVEKFSAIDPSALTKGLVGMGAMLVELTIFTKIMGSGASIVTTAIGLTILGGAMLIFAQAINNMGTMPTEVISKGLKTLAGALTIIAIAMKFMKTALSGAAALLVIAGALAILAPVLKLLGSMSIDQITQSLLALGGMFAVLGAATIILTPLIPALIGVAGAIALLGIGVGAIGGGVLALSIGLTALSVAGAGASVALVAIVSSLIGLIPFFLTKVGEGVIEFANVIALGGPAIINALVTILDSLLTAIETTIPKIVDTGIRLILGLLKGITEKIPQLIQAGYDLIIKFVNGMADAIRKNSQALIDAFFNLAGAMIDGLVKGLTSGFTKVVNTIKNLALALVDGFKKVLGINSPSKVLTICGMNMVDGLYKGLTGGTDKVKSAVDALAMTPPLSGYNDAGITAGLGYSKGVDDTNSLAKTAGVNVSTAAVEGLVSKEGQMKAAGTAAGKTYIDALNAATMTKIQSYGSAKEIGAASSARRKAEKAAAEKAGLQYGYTTPLDMSNEERSKYEKAGGGTAGFLQVEAARELAREAGEQVTYGFAEGITHSIKEVGFAMNEVTAAAIDAIKEDLKIKSPSKVFSKLGMYTMEGFAGGMRNFGYLASEEARNAGKASMDALKKSISNISKVISEDIDSSPIIRPVMDLSNVGKDSKKLNTLINKNLKIDGASKKASALIQGLKNSTEVPTGTLPQPVAGVEYSFVQNNYSPTALSRLDIYRQTKNQFSVLKGLVNS